MAKNKNTCLLLVLLLLQVLATAAEPIEKGSLFDVSGDTFQRNVPSVTTSFDVAELEAAELESALKEKLAAEEKAKERLLFQNEKATQTFELETPVCVDIEVLPLFHVF